MEAGSHTSDTNKGQSGVRSGRSEDMAARLLATSSVRTQFQIRLAPSAGRTRHNRWEKKDRSALRQRARLSHRLPHRLSVGRSTKPDLERRGALLNEHLQSVRGVSTCL